MASIPHSATDSILGHFDKLGSLLNQVSDGIFLLAYQDSEEPSKANEQSFQLIYYNAAFAQSMGFLSYPSSALLPTAIAQEFSGRVQQCVLTSTSCQWQMLWQGRTFFVLLSPTYSDQGNLIHIQGLCRPHPGDPSLNSPPLFSQAMWEATLTTDHHPVLGFNRDGQVVSFNAAARQWVTTVWEHSLQVGDAIVPLLGQPSLVTFTDSMAPVWQGESLILTQEIRGMQDLFNTYECRYTAIRSPGEAVMGICLTLLNHPLVTRSQEDQLKQQNIYLAALHRTSLGLMNRLDLTDVLEALMTEISAILGSEDGFLFLVDEQRLVLRVGVGLSESYRGFSLALGEGLAGQVWATASPLLIANYSQWPGRATGMDSSWKRAALAVPLYSGSQVIGVLGIAYTSPHRHLGDPELELLTSFAQLASLALDNVRLYEAAQSELIKHKQTQEHLTTTLRSIGDGVIVTDPAGHVQLMNTMAETLTGWSQTQAVGQPLSTIFQLIHAETYQPIVTPVAEVLQTQQIIGLQSQTLLRDRQGHERYIAASAAPIPVSETVTGVVLTFRDISQHKKIESSLRASEGRNRAILDALPDLVFRLNREGFYLDCKGDPHDLILPAQPLIGRPLSAFFAAPLATQWLEQINHALTSQQTQIFEYPLTLEGQERWFEARLVPAHQEEVIAIVRNITAAKDYQAEILQQTERERLLSAIALHIRASLNLDDILQTTVAEVRQFVQADRVVVYHFEAHHTGTVIAESVSPGWTTVLGRQVRHEWFENRHSIYQQDRPRCLTDTQTQSLPPRLRAYFQEFQVRSNLSIPLFLGGDLWGLLVVHQCREPRQWPPALIQLLQQLTNQVEIALQQADLHTQLQVSHEHLERQVRVRTAQLNKQIHALQLQEQVLSTVPNAIVVVHKAGHIIYWNRYAETLYGISAEASLGELVTDVIPFPRSQAHEVMQALYKGKSWKGELTLTHNDQTTSTLLISHSPTFDQEGGLIGTIGLSVDITQRQAIETALRESEARFRTLSETTTSAIFLVQFGHFLDVNVALTEITGYSRTELLGMSFWHIGHPDHQQAMTEWVDLDPLSLKAHQEFQIITRSGQEKWIDCTMGVITYKGKLTGLGTAVDITHRKHIELKMQQQMQELQQLNLLKDDFLSTVSHELRTPMSNMKLSIHMLKMMMLKAEQQGLTENKDWMERTNRYLMILHNECLREIDLINDLLDLQRLEREPSLQISEAIVLRETLSGIMAPFYSRSQEREQQLQLAISPDLPELMYGDRTALIRILAELLNNACKYSPPGALIILQCRNEQSTDPITLQFSVHNTGSEIPRAEQEHIFDKFYRVVENDRWKQGGTGLGLALIKKLVEQQRGSIQLDSGHNQTTFHVRLPLGSP